MLCYEVIDKNENRWAVYMYEWMAQRVAERNNKDTALAKLAPFSVQETQED